MEGRVMAKKPKPPEESWYKLNITDRGRRSIPLQVTEAQLAALKAHADHRALAPHIRRLLFQAIGKPELAAGDDAFGVE